MKILFSACCLFLLSMLGEYRSGESRSLRTVKARLFPVTSLQKMPRYPMRTSRHAAALIRLAETHVAAVDQERLSQCHFPANAGIRCQNLRRERVSAHG